jgi:hypothetical protein
MTNILGISGRKQSGKTTSSQFIMANTLASLGVLQGFTFHEDGELEALYNIDGENAAGFVDLLSKENQEFYQSMWIEQIGKTIDKTTKVYYFADDLKQKVCIDILGLTYEQCYGTNEQKDSLTHLKWEDMPGYAGPVVLESGQLEIFTYTLEEQVYRTAFWCEPGYMTARQVMQFVGTKLFRRMYNNVWVDSTIRRIQKEAPDLAIIGDCRFPNEVEGIQKAGGNVIRLLREPHVDNDESETALDGYVGFNLVIDNREMTIKDTNSTIDKYLRDINWFPQYLLEVRAE